MASTGHVVVVGGPKDLLRQAADRLDHLERCWSRFMPSSDISRLNRSAGLPVPVDHSTLLLVDRSVRGWRRTGGTFDPTVGVAMARLPVGGGSCHAESMAQPAPGCLDIHVDVGARTVRLPPGAVFDPGGIGKGLAADLIAEELVEGGASGALVNIGGDLRAVGEGPNGSWTVAVERSVLDRSRDHVAVMELAGGGGVATSTAHHRRWRGVADDSRHHVCPRTGRIRSTDVSSVTVVAERAWLAEVAAKVGIAASADRAVRAVEALGHRAIVESTSGVVLASRGLVGAA